MKTINNEAVSPVVGVMLMLVVTIIIAAVVSGFAGSIGGNTGDISQATISGEYSQTNGLEFTHTGGDTLTTTNLQVVLVPSQQFSRYGDQWAIPLAGLNIAGVSGERWIDTIYSFAPGDSAYLDADYIENFQDEHVGATDKSYVYHINNPENVGKTITLNIYDSRSNTLIGKTDIIVNS
jgi:FlaG/FlaF family flagellin (archaellin)